MDFEERANKAVELKHAHGCNCCQAVVMALADQTNLKVDDLVNMAGSFGLGMGNMEATCGALIGAGMILGLVTNGNRAAARALNETFKQKCGAITCEDLKGRFTGKVLCPCDDCVKNAVLAYGEMLEKI